MLKIRAFVIKLAGLFRSVVRVIFRQIIKNRWEAVWNHSNKVMIYSETICEDLLKTGKIKGPHTSHF